MNYRLRNGKSLLVAPAEPEDAEEFLEAVARMGAETPFLTFGGEGLMLSVQQERDFLAGARKDGLMLKAVVDGKIVGSLSVMRVLRPRVQHVVEFGVSVLRSHWGLGVGTRLLEEMLAWARGAGVRKVNLRVHEDNARARELYLRLGFKEEGLKSRAFLIDGKFHAEWMMGMELD